MRYYAITLFIFSFLFIETANAEVIASCSNLKGHAYYPHQDIISEKDSGWKQDEVSPSVIELHKEGAEYDITYLDSTKKSSSTIKHDKAKIISLYNGKDDFSLLVQYPSGGTDIYRFFKESNETTKFALMSARTQISKNSLMIGDCSYIKFEN